MHFKNIIKSIRHRIPFMKQMPLYISDPVKNAELAALEYKQGKTILSSLPPIITFALTTFCSNRTPCLICDRNIRPPEGDMETNYAVINAVEPLLRTARVVLLHCGGEAMFSKYFDNVINIISPPTKISFATNGMLLTKKRADILLEKDIITIFNLSLDSATEKAYRLMRPGSDWNTVLKNIKYFINKARRLNRKDARVSLNMTVCELNLKEVPKLIDLAVEIGAYGVDFNHLNSGLSFTRKTIDNKEWNYEKQSEFKDKKLHDEMILKAYKKARKNSIRMVFVGKPFIGPGSEKIDKKIKDDLCELMTFPVSNTIWQSPYHDNNLPGPPFCFKPWRETVIQPNGDIRICYFHDGHLYTVGNIVKSDFYKFWNSEIMIKEREQFLKNRYSEKCMASTLCLHRGRL